ncbi:hypothetical protein CTAYLR_002720 [Chrysophaeum taylorii]|uniref:Kelch repeat protein n=1 Tax=Chrysophaeum taylorii TaxID=2483200 RepID=A0AAD7UBN9_9STRA|nr:hypothetical protein CTAYLR_002720 [Chrysophaeum taylorii]
MLLVGGAAWEERAEMPVALSDMSATAIGAHSILLIGGCVAHQLSCGEWCSYCPTISARALEYNTVDDRWREMTEAPRARYRHAAAYDGNDVFVVGGRDVSDAIIDVVDVYAVTSNSWTTLMEVEISRSDLGAFVYEGWMYAYGGYDQNYTSLSGATVVHLERGTLLEHEAPSLLEPRGDFGMLIHGTMAYAVGGFSHSDWCEPLRSVERIDLSADDPAWELAIPLVTGRGDKSLAAVEDALVAAGGEHNNGCETLSTPVKDVEVMWNFRGDWSVFTAIPEAKYRGAAVGLENTVYNFGGQSAQETTCPDSSAFCYPVTNHTWSLVVERGDDDDDDDSGGLSSGAMAGISIAIVIGVIVLGILLLRYYRRHRAIALSKTFRDNALTFEMSEEKNTLQQGDEHKGDDKLMQPAGTATDLAAH